MNILPKKRWHVRTKDNIARVRRDEAEAADQERKRFEKQQYAESEARLNLLRSKAGKKHSTSIATQNCSSYSSSNGGHIDLFTDFQFHNQTVNKEHEEEKKLQQEKYEKQIGYLTYLGQNTNEALKLRSWYEIAPRRAEIEERDIIETDLKKKYLNDPLTLVKTILPKEKSTGRVEKTPCQQKIEYKKQETHQTKTDRKNKLCDKSKKKHKKKEKQLDKEESSCEKLIQKKLLIDKLRKERLERESKERARQQKLLCPNVVTSIVAENLVLPKIIQKYNSQFNPELAKQNIPK